MRVLGRSRTVANYVLAEKEGFEPSVRINVHTLSKRAPSATRTLLLSPFFAQGKQKREGSEAYISFVY